MVVFIPDQRRGDEENCKLAASNALIVHEIPGDCYLYYASIQCILFLYDKHDKIHILINLLGK